MEENIKILDVEQSPGVVSLMRKSVKTVVKVGVIMIIAGILMGSYSTVTEKAFELVSFYSLLVTSGAGMISLALGAKAWQAQGENSLPS
jgi:predicted Co/Zn/Cd cation transporter (cation efflux family)